ncbi:MAG: response regulator transcription factor [Prevotella sp.]|jgi:DNA-binding CsgD family transcriptional regulator
MQPKIAIIDPNTLATIGMKQLLTSIVPMVQAVGFGSFDELMANHPEEFVHFFVAQSIVIAERDFFLEHRHKTIVMTVHTDPASYLTDFRTLCVNGSEKTLLRSVLQLIQAGHPHGKNLPHMPQSSGRKILSDREVEVLALLAQGKMNKEIADQLNISLTTVISHRKNIIDKLGIKSVSGLTIYAVTHGYVDINKI